MRQQYDVRVFETCLAAVHRKHSTFARTFQKLPVFSFLLQGEVQNKIKVYTLFKPNQFSENSVLHLLLNILCCILVCNIKYEKVGCFVDKLANSQELALPEKILNENQLVKWDKWNSWLPEFVCRCANIVHKKNYQVFGIRNFGWYICIFILFFIIRQNKCLEPSNI